MAFIPELIFTRPRAVISLQQGKPCLSEEPNRQVWVGDNQAEDISVHVRAESCLWMRLSVEWEVQRDEERKK